MFKVISAELKKIVSKPGIYILSALLAIILVLGVIIYKPIISNYHQSFALNGNTFIEKYTDFNKSSVAGKKAEITENINKAVNSINNYTISANGTTYSQKEYIVFLIEQCNNLLADYQDCATDNSYQDYINTTKNKLVSSFETLNNTIESALVDNNNYTYALITSKDNYYAYKNSYKDVITWAKTSVTKANLSQHINEFETKYKSKFYSAINNFKYPTLSAEFVKNYTQQEDGTKLSILNERLNKIWLKMQDYYNIAYNSEKDSLLASKMDELANQYEDTANTYINLVKYELICNAFNYTNTKEQLSMLNLSTYSNFNSKSMLVKYDYLFKHNKTLEDYSNPLTIGVTSNNETNAYDYAYFVLKVFSFVIIIYAMMACCHTIAGEIKEGSMRYLAIRPISRTNLYLGKWFSIIVMSLILMLFSSIIAVCVGGAVYGFSTLPILTIFNGSFAITIHPIIMLFVYLLSMLVELLIYTTIAMMLSVLFKSDLLSVTILISLYLINLLLPTFVQGINSWLTFYPFSHISLYSLFGSSVYATNSNYFNLLFGEKIYAGSHIALTLSISILIVLLVSMLTIKLFKKKEL